MKNKHVEIAKDFPLSAEHFKLGNASETDIYTIKQHSRIEKAITENFSLSYIYSKLEKKDTDLLLKYLKRGFSLDETALLCREISVSKAIEAFVLVNNGKLDLASAEAIGFEQIIKKIHETPKKVKEIIRSDAAGNVMKPHYKENSFLFTINNYFFNDDEMYKTHNVKKFENRKKKNYSWSSLFQNNNDYKRLTGRIQDGLFKAHNLDEGREIKSDEFASFIKKLSQGEHNYNASSYDLSNSAIWVQYYSKFKSFRKVEQQMKETMASHKIMPEIVERMNFSDFNYLLHKSSKDEEKEKKAIFEGAIRRRVKQIMKNPQNCETVEKYMHMNNVPKEKIEENIKAMKEEGILCNLFSVHHIDHVSNAFEHDDVSKLNNPENLVLVSAKMHQLIHSSDSKMDNGTISLVCPPKGKFDMMLGVTPLFQTPYTPPTQDRYKEIIYINPVLVKRSLCSNWR